MALPFLNAQSKNLSTSADCALSAGSLYIRMNDAVLMGQLSPPLALTIEMPMPGTLNQSALAAAEAKDLSSGLTYLPSAFCSCRKFMLFFLT